MIVVKVELHSARTGRVTQLGKMYISNDGTILSNSLANYNVELLRKGTEKVLRRGRVEQFPKAAYSIWRLVFRALRSVLHEETQRATSDHR